MNTHNPPLPKRRTLRFAAPDAPAMSEGCSRLHALPGITATEPAEDHLCVSYTLGQTSLEQIEVVLAEAGLTLRSGWHRWQRALWRFQEHNELANQAHAGESSCCNRPPAKLR